MSPEVLADFNSLVEPLEKRTGQRLNGPGRQRCWRAFQTHPDGFRRLVVVALREGKRNPVGLLVYMVGLRDHELEPIGEASKEAN